MEEFVRLLFVGELAIVIKGEDLHGANIDADTTLDARCVGVGEGLFSLREALHIDSDLAVSGTLSAADALVVRLDL
jgi:hypothetical protein